MAKRMLAALFGFAVIGLGLGVTGVAQGTAQGAVQGTAQGTTQNDERIAALSAKATLTPPEQQELAAALFKIMAGAKTDDPKFYEERYRIVMEKCPATDRAHESYWRLTNLYLRAYDEPKHAEIVKLLEQFLARYTASTVLSMVKYPDEVLVFSPIRSLHQSYEELGQHAKIAAYYDKIAGQEKAFRIYDYFDYASALDKSARPKDAIVWYQKFLDKTKGNDDVEFMREVAADRIKELKGGGVS